MGNKIALIIFYAVLALVLIGLFIMNWIHDSESSVSTGVYIRDRKIYAVVHDKYVSFNHNVKILEVQNFNPNFGWKLDFDEESSGVYNFIQVGDTIAKDSGTLTLEIINTKIDTLWNLRY